MSMTTFAVRSPVKVTMLFVAILLLGVIALQRLPTNLFPDVRAPKITVTVRTKGMSPTEVERRICEEIERSLYSIRGVLGVQGIARADQAVVVVDFDWDTRMEYAFLEVKKAAGDLQRERSSEIESVSVLRYDPNAAPVMTLALTAPEGTDLESVFRTAQQTLKPRFERLAGVANVVLTGGMEREIAVLMEEGALLANELTVAQVVDALKNENVNATGGWIEEGNRRLLLKTIGEFQRIDEVRRVVVARPGGVPLLLSDVASVEFAPKEATSLVYMDRKPAVGMAFYREAEGNTLAVARQVRQEIEDSKGILPTGWSLQVASDESQFIAGAINEVRNNALLGGALAVVILMVFLRDLRTTLIIAVAIPVSVVATFNLMYFQGLTLNLMTLGGLALGTGMLVDNAIVVLENIFRLRGETDAKDAAARGTREVAGALVASTLTTVAVFLPIIYVRGVAAMLFREQGLTVAYSLLGSLLVALLLIPVMAAYFLGNTPPHLLRHESLAVPRGLYPWLLGHALRVRWLVLLFGVGLTVLAGALAVRLPREFLPSTDVPEIALRVVMPNGTPIATTDRVVASVTEQLDRYEPFLEHVFRRVGEPRGVVNANTEDPDGPNTADLLIRLRSVDEPTTAMLATGLHPLGSRRLIAGLKPVLDRMEDAKTEFRSNQGSVAGLLGGARAPLLVEIAGPELEDLTRLAAEAQARLSTLPQLLNVRTNILEGAPEARLTFDKVQLSRLGLDTNTLAAQLRQRIDGEVATQVRRESGDVDIRVAMDYGTESLDMLSGITLRSGTGALVRIGAVADIEVIRGPREIMRQRQQRVALVMADLDDGVKLSDAITAAEAALDPLVLPRRYTLRFTGEEEQRQAAFGDLGFALVLSIVLVYMVMASIFESFLQPFLILLTIPLAGIGVVGGMILTNQTLNVMSVIGIIMLGGIVVNNAIVLLDCVNQVRGEPEAAALASPSRDTLLIGCGRRLRPVLMTTLTTMLGLVPMAMGLGDGAELRQAMAIAVLGGLLSSMVLTLFVIPCGQSVLDSAAKWLRSNMTRTPGA